jgi:hypothetical protein
MKAICLRDSRDRRRFIGRRGWIQGERRARRFDSVHAALVFAFEHELWEAEVLVCFGEAATADISINIPRETAAACMRTTTGWPWPGPVCECPIS